MKLEPCASWREFSQMIGNMTFGVLNPTEELRTAHSSSMCSTYVTATIIDIWSNSSLLSPPSPIHV